VGTRKKREGSTLPMKKTSAFSSQLGGKGRIVEERSRYPMQKDDGGKSNQAPGGPTLGFGDWLCPTPLLEKEIAKVDPGERTMVVWKNNQLPVGGE